MTVEDAIEASSKGERFWNREKFLGKPMDPDVAEQTNLNRQVFLYDGIGISKAETLAKRLNKSFGTKSKSVVEYFRRDTIVSRFDVIFDCVDNFETRIVLSEKCRDEKKLLVSGGTNIDAGQVVIYNPLNGGQTPAELLGLYEIVNKRKIDSYQRQRASCAYRPNPSVIMTNQIVAGFMVDSYRMMLAGQDATNTFYESGSDKRIGVQND